MNIDKLIEAADRLHRASIVELAEVMSLDPDPESPLGKRLTILSAAIEAYEITRWPIGVPTQDDGA